MDIQGKCRHIDRASFGSLKYEPAPRILPLMQGYCHQNVICSKNEEVERGFVPAPRLCSTNIGTMGALAFAIITYIRAFFVPRHRLALEAAALRQQLAVFKRKQPRPRLNCPDRFFWMVLWRLSSRWQMLSYWSNRKRWCPGIALASACFGGGGLVNLAGPRVDKEIRELIWHMKAENPTWGAPRIHGELLQLGFEVSEPTVSRYLQCAKRRGNEGKAKHWLAFLNNHREVIAAFDFFTVPTLNFQTLYRFFVIEHGRRRILHFNQSERIAASTFQALFIVWNRDR